MFSSILHKSIDTVSHEGFTSFFRKVLQKVKNSCFRHTSSIWFCKNVAESFQAHAPDEKVQIQFQLIDDGNLLDWIKENHSRFPWLYFPAEIEIARQEKHFFACIRQQDRIVGYIKIGNGRVYVHDFDRIINFPSWSAFIYDTFVLPEFRRKQVAFYAITEAIKFLHQSGFKTVWCHIESWNTASLNAFKKAGFEARGAIRYLKFCGFGIFIKNGCRPLIKLEPFLS